MEVFNDDELLRQIKTGSSDAFSEIYNKYWDKTFMQAYDRLKDIKQSQDLTQDIFIRLWERRTSLDIQNLPAYLNTAVRNNVFKLVASHKVNEDCYNIAERLLPHSSSADHQLITDELIKAFHSLVDNMPPQRKKIFQLRYEQDLKTGVIAQQLNITQKTVQNHLLSSYRDIRFLLAQLLSMFIFLFQFSYF
ncbi:MAG: sigma-70 family RNA polymerase sigma factor [Chitinophagaceae bacterium]|nr:sigma-70 family RNA polymerase sigma factor [Chitinophagaceae bacterium]